MLAQGNLRQDEFPTLSGGPQGGPPDAAAYGRHPAYDEDERHFMQPSGAQFAFAHRRDDTAVPL